MRVVWPVAVILAAGLSTQGCGRTEPAPKPQPNVVLFVLDTVRADRLHTYGHRRATSPTVDRLAERGVLFETAVAAWPETRQSMAALLTGLYPKNNGVVSFYEHPVAEQLVLLPEVLRDAGYETVAFVENSTLTEDWGFAQGVNEYELSEDHEPWQSADGLAERWLEQDRDPTRPFFLWVHVNDAHATYEPPPPFQGMFVNDQFYDPGPEVEVRGDDRLHDAVGGFPGYSRLGDHTELGFYMAEYDAEIRTADAKVARVLQAIENQGLADDTIIVLTSDHGEGFGEHNHYWHGFTTYEEVARVPLVFSGPGISGPSRMLEPVNLVDLLPTVLDLLAVQAPSDLDGVSLKPLLDGSAVSLDRRYVFTESGWDFEARQLAVRDGRYKLVHIPKEYEQQQLAGVPWELFDLQEDPAESRNRLHDLPDEVDRLRAVLEAWWNNPSSLPADPLEVGAEERLRLEALGYAERRDG